MYLPSHFEEPDIRQLHALIARHPFGIIVHSGATGLDANHLPFLLNPEEGRLGHLHAHVARANPMWQEIAEGEEVLVIFRAGHAYVSPNWYPSKHEFHRQVPTWNYQLVHAHGKLRIHDNERYVRRVVSRLTQIHEASESRPWKMGDAPADYLDTMLKAIVGIEVEITRIAGKFKLSQNKECRDIEGAGRTLKAQGHTGLGDAMLAAAEKCRQASPSST